MWTLPQVLLYKKLAEGWCEGNCGRELVKSCESHAIEATTKIEEEDKEEEKKRKSTKRA